MRDAHARPPLGRPPLGSELAQPWPATALALLVLNDHVWKAAGALPGWLTGKLSDFAGLFLFPVVLFVAADAVGRLCGRSLASSRSQLAWLCATFTALLFAALKLNPALNAAANARWGTVALDSTDLVALPMCAASALWLARPVARAASSRGLRAAIALIACFACAATSSPRELRNYPAWQLRDRGAHWVGCTAFESWVSKSGKQGVGITVRLQSLTAAPCPVRIDLARIQIAGRSVVAAELPPATTIAAAPLYLYLAFPFDNEASWNREELRARLELQLTGGTHRARLRRELVHRWDAPHRPWPEPPPDVPRARTDLDAHVAGDDDGGVP